MINLIIHFQIEQNEFITDFKTMYFFIVSDVITF